MSFKNQVFKRTNVTVDGNLKVSGEINGGLIQQIQSAATAIGQLQSQGFLGDLYVRGQVYETFGRQWVATGAGLLSNGLCFGNAVFVGGNGTIIERSVDFGATWSTPITPFTASIKGGAFGGNVFILVSIGPEISRSTDNGATWSALIANPFLAAQINCVVYANGVFIAGGNNGHIARSTDLGVTWGALITNPFGVSAVNSMAYGSGVTVAVANGGKIARSTDGGVTWNALLTNPFGASNVNSVSFGNGIFVAVGDAGKMARSVDGGLTWGSLITNPFGANNLLSVSYNFATFQVGSGAGQLASSIDGGVTWGALQSNPFGTGELVQSIASSTTNLVAAGSAGTVATAGWNAVWSSAPEQLYTPTFTNFGTCTAINFSWRRVGNRVVVMGKFTAGVTVAGEARISLPFGVVSDTALIPNLQVCGVLINNVVGAVAYYTLIESGVAYITIGQQAAGNNAITKGNGNLFVNTAVISVQFEVPVQNWNQ